MANRKRSAEGDAEGTGAEPRCDLPARSFEGALEQLEETVGRLEEGEMPLEEALELFEVGVKLSGQCSATLEAAERRIEVLVAERDGDGFVSEPFDGDLGGHEADDGFGDEEEDFED